MASPQRHPSRNILRPNLHKKKIRVDWATSAYISATFLRSKKGTVLPPAGREGSRPGRRDPLLARREPASCHVARLCTLMFTRSERLSSRVIVKTIQTVKQSATCASGKLRLGGSACTAVVSAGHAVTVKNFQDRTGSQYINIDTKIHEKNWNQVQNHENNIFTKKHKTILNRV